MASFYIPLTGLESDSTALNTIANDLANLNTTGFKAQTVNFSDLFYQQIGTEGSGDPIQLGSGVGTSAIESEYTQGSIVSTGNATDVALDGNGFFVLNDGGTNVYSRDGNFGLTATGGLVTASGLEVMGYPAAGGVVNTNAPLTPINIPVGSVEAAQATSSFGMTANLNATAAVGAVFPTQITMYDSLGVPQTATVTYTKTAANTWSYNITVPETLSPTSVTAAGVTTLSYSFGSVGGGLGTVDPGTNLTISGVTPAVPPAVGNAATIVAPAVTAGETVATYVGNLNTALTAAGLTNVTAAVSASGQVTITGPNVSTSGSIIKDPIASANASGKMTFDSSGNLTSPSSNLAGISFSGLTDGAANLVMSWNILGANGKATISQTDAASAVSSTTQNGYASGQYQTFSISGNGTVEASFSNGQQLAVGQLAMANVANVQGLQLLGNGEYAATQASGTAAIGTSGTSGLGTMQDAALEESNVNISAEFSALIIAQRAFEANSKAVTTFDTVAQETINMIH